MKRWHFWHFVLSIWQMWRKWIDWKIKKYTGNKWMVRFEWFVVVVDCVFYYFVGQLSYNNGFTRCYGDWIKRCRLRAQGKNSHSVSIKVSFEIIYTCPDRVEGYFNLWACGNVTGDNYFIKFRQIIFRRKQSIANEISRRLFENSELT